jgi:hypothetical protein
LKPEANKGKVSWETLSEKQTKKKSKRNGGMDKIIEHLPSQYEALNSIPTSASKMKTK